MPKKKSSKKPTKKQESSTPAQPVELDFGGHRDLAEKLSQDYYLTANRVGWQAMPELLDMDNLTSMLQQLDGDVLTRTMSEPYAQGLLMGMLHQTVLYDTLSSEEDAQE